MASQAKSEEQMEGLQTDYSIDLRALSKLTGKCKDDRLREALIGLQHVPAMASAKDQIQLMHTTMHVHASAGRPTGQLVLLASSCICYSLVARLLLPEILQSCLLCVSVCRLSTSNICL